MAITEEALKQIVGALRPPLDGTDVQARDSALLVRLRGWVAEFGMPPKEVRAKRRRQLRAREVRRAALLQAFSTAEVAWRAMEDHDEGEFIQDLFEGYRPRALFIDQEQERPNFTQTRASFLELCEAFNKWREPEAPKAMPPSQRGVKKKPFEYRVRRAILELAELYKECTGLTPGITIPLDLDDPPKGLPPSGEWFVFATSFMKAAWDKPYTGILRAETTGLRKHLIR